MCVCFVFVRDGQFEFVEHSCMVGSVRFGSVSFSRNWLISGSRFGSVRGKLIRKSVRFGSVFHLHYVMGMYFCFF